MKGAGRGGRGGGKGAAPVPLGVGGKGNIAGKGNGGKGRGDDGGGKGGGGKGGGGKGAGGGRGGGKGKGEIYEYSGGKGGGRGKGGGSSSYITKQPSGEPFSAAITFNGKVDDFLVAGDTFIPAALYEAFHLPSELVEGAIMHGLRVPNIAGKASKWRASRIERVEPPPPPTRQQLRQQQRMAGQRQSGNATAGEAFSELVTYAGRAETFVVAGGSTFVPSSLLTNPLWKPIFEGDRIIGRRTLNSGGSSKWKACFVGNVIRAEGPPLSKHDAWLESSQQLLSRIQRERSNTDGNNGASSSEPTGHGDDDGSPKAAADEPVVKDAVAAAARAEAARVEGLRLLDLAEVELKELLQREQASKQALADVDAAILEATAVAEAQHDADASASYLY